MTGIRNYTTQRGDPYQTTSDSDNITPRSRERQIHPSGVEHRTSVTHIAIPFRAGDRRFTRLPLPGGLVLSRVPVFGLLFRFPVILYLDSTN